MRWRLAALGECGSAVITVAIAGAVCSLSVGTVAIGAGLAERQRIVGAADAAALAAADAASGAVAGEPCAVAARVAAANRAVLDACATDGLVATVRTSGSALGVPLVASARAGPPTSP